MSSADQRNGELVGSVTVPSNNVNLYGRDSFSDFEQDNLNKTMDHLMPSAKKTMSKYKGSNSQKNMLTMKHFRKRNDFLPHRRALPKKDAEVSRLRKDLEELKQFKQKYLTMEQKMNRLEHLVQSEASAG